MTSLESFDLELVIVHIVIDALVALVAAGVMLLIVMPIERRVPHARPPSPGDAWFNIRYGVVLQVLAAAMQPLILGISLTLTRSLGTGWIAFSDSVVGWCLAFLAVLVTTDLLEYLFHRAEHSFSALWKLHEFHHTAEHYDVTLAYRHSFLEIVVKGICLYPLVGILFSVPAGVQIAIIIIYFVNHHVAHMNLRYSPKYALLIQHPQYHRLHHSRSERDHNKNFCDLFPLWDILFGTLRKPEPDEFVDIGLDSISPPRTLWQALLWPWCRARHASTNLGANAQRVTVGGGR